MTAKSKKPSTFQALLSALQDFWAAQHCAILQPLDMEVGAGTFHPATFLRAIGPEPWRTAYVQPCRRPTDGRYGDNPNRLQHYYQFQVLLKPSPKEIQEIYLDSLRKLGINPKEHDIRFVEDNWESPTLGAWGLGWEVWLDGMEVTQFTYFQQVGGLECRPVSGEITYGLERLAMYLQEKDSVYDLAWSESEAGLLTYGDVFHQNEREMSRYNFEEADTKVLFRQFEDCEQLCLNLNEKNLPLPAYEQVIKASHLFNLLDARQAISVAERQNCILRVRKLARTTAHAYYEQRKEAGFPLVKEKAAGAEKNSKHKAQRQKSSRQEDPSATYDFLVEIGTEELPPLALRELEQAFGDGVWEGLKRSGVINAREGAEVNTYATPRRLAVQLLDLHKKSDGEAEKFREIKGPSIDRAYDDSGAPTKAGIGFAKKQGSQDIPSLKDLPVLDSSKSNISDGLFRKGDSLVARKQAEQPSLQEVLPGVVREALKALPVERAMRWGDGDEEFVRPVHWAVLLLDEKTGSGEITSQPIEADILGVTAGDTTRGHRFMAPDKIRLENARSYEEQLHAAKVIADFDKRRQVIDEAVQDPIIILSHEDLLNEMTALVEWPEVLEGEFDKDFLKLPKNILIAVMQYHQRYLPIYSTDDTEKLELESGDFLVPVYSTDDMEKLESRFYVFSNISAPDSEKKDTGLNKKIVKGYERVLRARLEDALFFFQRDREKRLEDYREPLKGIVFREGLGTMYDKSERVTQLAEALAREIQQVDKKIDKEIKIELQNVVSAARLAKADLATEIVKEFPALQGMIGEEYATLDKEPGKVPYAIAAHYRPQGRDDRLPLAEGAVLALADRLDTMAGFFGAGVKPGGSGDPFGLRRAALGMLRILQDQEWDLDLRVWLGHAHSGYKELLPQEEKAGESTERALAFIMGRLVGLYRKEGVSKDVFTVVDDLKLGRPLDVVKRVQAVQKFSRLPEAKALSVAYKRASKILAKQKEQAEILQEVDENLLQENAEKQLYGALTDKQEEISPYLKDEKYIEALKSLASLRSSVDSLFDEVLVMTDSQALRNNRLALLQSLCGLFSSIAGIPLVNADSASMEQELFEHGQLEGKEYEDYCYIRDEVDVDALRAKNLCFACWRRFKPYADSKFKSGFKEDFHARFWEMYLASVLIDEGFDLKPRKDEEPDILISNNERKIWIEAVTPDNSEHETIIEEIQKNGRAVTISDGMKQTSYLIERYTNSISAKLLQYENHVKNKKVEADAPYIIALNGGRLHRARIPYISVPNIVRAVYPVGDFYIAINKITKEFKEEGHHYRSTIKKSSNDASIPTDMFMDKKYAGISGILFSNRDCYNLSKRYGSEFIFVHNLNARNPIPKGYFKMGEEYVGRVDEHNSMLKVTPTDWRKTRT